MSRSRPNAIHRTLAEFKNFCSINKIDEMFWILAEMFNKMAFPSFFYEAKVIWPNIREIKSTPYEIPCLLSYTSDPSI